MDRLPDYRSRLNALLDAKAHEPFKYGKHDCCLWGADVIQAITGIDVAEKYRGKYRSLSGGIKLLKADGYKDYIEYISTNLVEIEQINFAQFGDIAIAELDNGPAVVVHLGNVAIGPSEHGLTYVSLEKITRVFRV